MSIVKNILAYIAALLVYIPTKLIYLSCRKKIIRSTDLQELDANNKPYIFVFWHGRLLPMGLVRPRSRIFYAVISRHGDGQFIADIMKFMGVKSIRGSTNRKIGEHRKGLPSKNRGGFHVIRESIRILERGDCLAVTPDGPRGPGFKFKPNLLKVASQTGVPIILASFSASNAKIFNTWDKFILPMPFSKLKLKCSEAKYIPTITSDEELKKYSKLLENELNNLTSELDNELGLMSAVSR